MCYGKPHTELNINLIIRVHCCMIHALFLLSGRPTVLNDIVPLMKTGSGPPRHCRASKALDRDIAKHLDSTCQGVDIRVTVDRADTRVRLALIYLFIFKFMKWPEIKLLKSPKQAGSWKQKWVWLSPWTKGGWVEPVSTLYEIRGDSSRMIDVWSGILGLMISVYYTTILLFVSRLVCDRSASEQVSSCCLWIVTWGMWTTIRRVLVRHFILWM